jgi:CO/xanthine dehydrogenase FAD-binding subunit
MVGVNFGRLRPAGVIDVGGVAELRHCSVDDDVVRIGAAVTFGRIEAELPDVLPGLVRAARGVGSPQIRATATLGGNLGTASPAGDAHPALIALNACVEVASLQGTREIPAHEFFVGPGRNVLGETEVITAVSVPSTVGSRQEFSKIGTRNAMVIAVASLGLVIDPERRRVGVGLGSVGPTPIRAAAAEEFLVTQLWPTPDAEQVPLAPAGRREFAAEVRRCARPIDDVRGTAAYRAHTIEVMARRCLGWCLDGAT